MGKSRPEIQPPRWEAQKAQHPGTGHVRGTWEGVRPLTGGKNLETRQSTAVCGRLAVCIPPSLKSRLAYSILPSPYTISRVLLEIILQSHSAKIVETSKLIVLVLQLGYTTY